MICKTSVNIFSGSITAALPPLKVIPFQTRRKGIIDVVVHDPCLQGDVILLAGPDADWCRHCGWAWYGHPKKRSKATGRSPAVCPNPNCKTKYWWRPPWTREEMKAKAPEWGRKGARESKRRRKEK